MIILSAVFRTHHEGLICAGLLTVEEQCHQTEHALCDGSMQCQDALTEFHRQCCLQERAGLFDPGRLMHEHEGKMPDSSWPTALLLRFVRTQALRVPTHGGIWRGTLITSALARLAERGVPADMVVRTWLGPPLIRRILRMAAHAWFDLRINGASHRPVPELQDWLTLLDTEPRLRAGVSNEETAIHRVMGGQAHHAAKNWLEKAAVAHIIGWRLNGYLKVPVQHDDLAFSGGHEATQWVFDRLYITYPDEWTRSSINWELAYCHDPEQISQAAGAPRGILQERHVPLESLLSGLTRRLVDTRPAEVDGMSPAEMFESVVSFLESGHLDLAARLAHRWDRVAPGHPVHRNMLAFCLIPTDPSRARDIFMTMDGLTSFQEALRRVNVACCSATLGESLNTDALLAGTEEDVMNTHAYLWALTPEVSAPRLVYWTLREWLEATSTALTSSQH